MVPQDKSANFRYVDLKGYWKFQRTGDASKSHQELLMLLLLRFLAISSTGIVKQGFKNFIVLFLDNIISKSGLK